jgi:DNA excision repair protein ERCC-4
MSEEGSACSHPVIVVADDRENAAPVIEVLRSLPGVEVLCQQLRVGDYRINNWIFERKTLIDLAESIIDGRLFSQAHRLASTEESAAIILEGRTSDLARSQMRREALQGALLSLSLVFQIPILRAFDPVETAHLLIYAGHQLSRQENEEVIRRGRRPKRRRRLQLYLLQGLPGIGFQKAERLLDAFGSVQAVMNASCEELQEIEGIGQKIARSIRWILDIE